MQLAWRWKILSVLKKISLNFTFLFSGTFLFLWSPEFSPIWRSRLSVLICIPIKWHQCFRPAFSKNELSETSTWPRFFPWNTFFVVVNFSLKSFTLDYSSLVFWYSSDRLPEDCFMIWFKVSLDIYSILDIRWMVWEIDFLNFFPTICKSLPPSGKISAWKQ